MAYVQHTAWKPGGESIRSACGAVLAFACCQHIKFCALALRMRFSIVPYTGPFTLSIPDGRAQIIFKRNILDLKKKIKHEITCMGNQAHSTFPAILRNLFLGYIINLDTFTDIFISSACSGSLTSLVAVPWQCFKKKNLSF